MLFGFKIVIMIRTYITPKQTNCHIELNFPKEYLGEELEIIVFKKNEGLKKVVQKKSFALPKNPITENELVSMVKSAENAKSISLKESKKLWTKRRKALEKTIS
jgi:hypothetical protein